MVMVGDGTSDGTRLDPSGQPQGELTQGFDEGLLDDPGEIPQPRLLTIPREPIIPLPSPSALLPRFKALRQGCYLIRFTPSGVQFPNLFPLVHYNGTLRVEISDGIHASGDLYQHAIRLVAFPTLVPSTPEPNPAAGIPIFAIRNYRYYLRVTSLQWISLGSSINMRFERYAFNHTTKAWTNQGTFTATMTWTAAPAGYPDTGQYLTGAVRDPMGLVVGNLTMGWVAASLRRAMVEIDRVAVSEAATANAAGSENWGTVFNRSLWRMGVVLSNANITEPSGESWSNAELHAQLLASRDQNNLDIEWRYVLLCVRRLDETTRGIMFDNGATDSNNVPREGAAISSHWVIPNDRQWGSVAGQRFGLAKDPYFRTALHEIGHALNLIHEESEGISGTTIMTTTPTVVGNASAANPFPGNITWDFHPHNKHHIKHWPDIYVRPGGVAFAQAHGTTPIAPDDIGFDAEGITCEVLPVRESFPIGAPVRFNVRLTNTLAVPVAVPAVFTYESGRIEGAIKAPGGGTQPFKPIVLCIEEETLEYLDPGASKVASVTLLRSAGGPLFATPGLHTITAVVRWASEAGIPVVATGDATVWITDATDESHREAAAAVLTSADLSVVLALGGGDHLTDGIAALDKALAVDELRPHYAATEALRAGRSFFDRDADPGRVDEVLGGGVVAGADEIESAARLVKRSTKAGSGAVQALRAAAEEQPNSDDLTAMLDDLR
jgi:hypothetical protein